MWGVLELDHNGSSTSFGRKQMTTPKICIGISTNRGVKAQTTGSMMRMAHQFPYEIFVVMATDGVSAPENRTYIVREAMKEKCTHILFSDDDMVFNPDTLGRLLAHNKEIVGTAPNMRCVPSRTTVRFMDEKGELLPEHHLEPDFKMPTQLFKAYAVGTGLMLVETKVFNDFFPWFKFEFTEAGFVKIGEDVFFCREAKKKGYEIYCDPTITVGHCGEYVY